MSIPLTVALTTYNRSEYLKEAIEGVLSQTYRDFEFLILDNGSVDNTSEVVLSYKDSRIRYVKNSPGYNTLFNSYTAHVLALGERLIITHDDDIMMPDMLEKFMDILSNRPDVNAVWCNKIVIDKDGAVIQESMFPSSVDRVFEVGEFIASTSESRAWHPASAMIFNHRKIPIKNIYNCYVGVKNANKNKSERIKVEAIGGGDLVRPAVMNLSGAVVYVSEPLLKYRVHPNQETNNSHLSKSIIYNHTIMRKLVLKTPLGATYASVFECQIIRYKAQEVLMSFDKSPAAKNLLSKVRSLFIRGLLKGKENRNALIYLLPILIFIAQHGDKEDFNKFPREILDSRIDSSLFLESCRSWVLSKEDGRDIFPPSLRKRKIVIFGSVFVSALLISELQLSGFEVVCCIDSNVTRVGNKFLNLDIFHPSWLSSNLTDVDFIFTTSERDHEDKLDVYLRSFGYAGEITSWKSLFN